MSWKTTQLFKTLKEIEEINNKIDFLYTDISHRIAENDISYIPAFKRANSYAYG